MFNTIIQFIKNFLLFFKTKKIQTSQVLSQTQMATWKFTDEYGTKYPAIKSSILDMLVFTNKPTLGSTFQGTISISDSGVALSTLSLLTKVTTTIPVSGTISDANNTLTIGFSSTNNSAFTQGIADTIPLIGNSVTKDASMAIKTVVKTTDSVEDGPEKDEFDLDVKLQIGNNELQLVAGIPMNGGFFTIKGTFTGVGIALNDLNFLMGSLSSGDSWFPATELGPYYSSSASLDLLDMALSVNVNLSPFNVSITDVTVSIGLSKIPLINDKLYLNPLGVCVTVVNPTSQAVANWGIMGTMVLCNYQTPGNVDAPDFSLDFTMGLTDYSFNADLQNPSNNPVNLMLQDLISSSTDISLPATLTIDKFDISADADKTTGKISDFSFETAMSGGFGLFDDFDVESFSLSITYSR
jgi:hypothetical protein